MKDLKFNHEFEIGGKYICIDVPKEKCNQVYIEGELVGTVWECRKRGVISFVSRDFKLAPYLESITIELSKFYKISI